LDLPPGYSHVARATSKTRAHQYIAAGWKLIGTHTELNHHAGAGQTIIVYELGWPTDEDGPVMPPPERDPSDLLKMDPGPSAN
jgi:hypothetical protein